MRTQSFAPKLMRAVSVTLGIILFGATLLLGAPENADAQQAVDLGKLLSPHKILNLDGTLDTSRGASGAVDLRGWNVTLDSVRGPILSPSASAPDSPNAPSWSAFANNGLNIFVNALAVSGSDLYVGGEFNHTADLTVTLNHVAKYSGGAWSAFANNGLNGNVFALAASGSDLYVGGSFTQTFDGAVTGLNHIAKYSGGAWSALANNGLNNWVNDLTVSGSDLYVGGGFTQTADGAVTNLTYVTRLTEGCTAKPAKPTLVAPPNGKTVKKQKVFLDWDDVSCTDSYQVLVRLGSKEGTKVDSVKNLPTSQYKTKTLTRGQTYYWRASACNTFGCAKSGWRRFMIKP